MIASGFFVFFPSIGATRLHSSATKESRLWCGCCCMRERRASDVPSSYACFYLTTMSSAHRKRVHPTSRMGTAVSNVAVRQLSLHPAAKSKRVCNFLASNAHRKTVTRTVTVGRLTCAGVSPELTKPFGECAGGGGRTRTELSLQRILSPLRMPFRHPGLTRT